MPTTWTALAVTLLAVVPGFLTVSIWARSRTWRGPSSDLRTILQSIAISAVIQVAVSPLTVVWIVPLRTDPADHPWRIVLWIAIVVLVAPAALGRFIGRLGDRVLPPEKLFLEEFGRIRRSVGWVIGTPIPPTIWDWVITTEQADGKFVLVTFEDGKQIAGEYSKPSLALTSPEPQGIFIAKEWILDADGDLERVLPGSKGILIPSLNGVRSIRILESYVDWSQELKGAADGKETGSDKGSGPEQAEIAGISAAEEVRHEPDEQL